MKRFLIILFLLSLCVGQFPVSTHAASGSDIPTMCGTDVDKDGKNIAAGPEPWTIRLIFADKATRQYLSGVDVIIQDDKGNQLFEILCDGAWMVAALKPGKYKAVCSYEAKSQEKVFEVGKKGLRTVYMFW